MTHLSIWDGKTHINITDQFHKNYCILSLPLPFLLVLFHVLVFSVVHHSSLRRDHFTWDRKQFFLFFQQYHNGKGGNTVTVGGAKMECLGHKNRTMPGGREMHEEDIISALKLTSFTNSSFTLVSYKCGKSSKISRQHLLTCIDRPEVQCYPV